MRSDQIIIRFAEQRDVPALAALHVETFHETHGKYPGSPDIVLRLNQWKKMFAENDGSWFCYVLEDSEKNLIGFAKGQPYKDELSFEGELNKIYLLKRYHRIGLGKKLICEVAAEFLQRDIKSMVLFGDANNPGNGFYEAMGGEKLITKKGEFHGGYGWRDLNKFKVQG